MIESRPLLLGVIIQLRKSMLWPHIPIKKDIPPKKKSVGYRMDCNKASNVKGMVAKGNQ